MSAPASAAADAINMAIPAYEEDPDEEFVGAADYRDQFSEDDDRGYYEDFIEPLEQSSAQSGGPLEGPHEDVLSDYTQLGAAPGRTTSERPFRRWEH